MLFFPQLLDPAENWIKFFMNPNNQLLDYRNVWLVYPRNFGTSDCHSSWNGEDMANDVVRFMYNNKISTATVGGHGLGAKVALASACYHTERFTGFYGIDYAPVNYRNYEPFRELVTYLNAVKGLNLQRPKAAIAKQLDSLIADPKWCEIFKQNLAMVSPGNYRWNFDLHGLLENVNHSTMEHIGAWNSHYGLWAGRSMWAFPEYSRWCHLGTNTLPMHKVAVKTRGYGTDIFALPGDEDPNTHWLYEDNEQSEQLAARLSHFVSLYDGVHPLMSDRAGLKTDFIPDRVNSRNAADFNYSEYIPSHQHHNWRFRDQK